MNKKDKINEDSIKGIKSPKKKSTKTILIIILMKLKHCGDRFENEKITQILLEMN